MNSPSTFENDSVPPVVAPTEEDHGNTHWVTRAAFPLLSASLTVSQVALGFAYYYGIYWLCVPLVLLASHFMHGILVGFHEASHGHLRKSRFLNEADGLIIGTFSFMSFSLYRAAHQKHHSHLATERDVELWPFVTVGTPRWTRRLAAFLELNFGILFTPFLFLRVFLQKDSFIRNKRVRRRIWMEYALVVVVWILIFSTVSFLHIWDYYLWVFLIPGVIAGNLQSWRKYIEHVGLKGHTARSATRSIVADSWSGRLLSLTLLHEPLHGIHHVKMALPYDKLPKHTALLDPDEEGDIPPFPNYRSAMMHLLRNLSDPKSGSHWPEA
ncbi:MAG: fatty acid desaturase [Luteolibacter sp.]|uniref:fatty acid desaturase family protein n=1 Tax=Luteolibacter sp. TaxID=1962973 RepID=UPI003267958F